MPIDIRAEAARYYDCNPDCVDDIAFYRERIPGQAANVLELGCGTGRVLLPLTGVCGSIHGVDISEAMLALCREKLARAAIPPSKARVEAGDITRLDLGRTFDLITAPYRVFQNLETDAEVDGFFSVVRKHLAPGGTCILNVFKPKSDRKGLRDRWSDGSEYFSWEQPIEGGRVACYGRNARIHPTRMILYPELIYRAYQGDALVDEATLKIVMRCYYPEEFERLILDHGFRIIQRWGGYAGEPYGEGPELVIQFSE
ncbi:MAG: class I SAM-dependent methyltransferase [Candidatus Sumerlaeota bacterium]|nr:class I SAM-dependent methyltransferase [Candidatus Sumerlaeota bacterium]